MNTMRWKRWGLGMMSGIGLLLGSVFAGPAAAQDVVLYEVTEAVATKGIRATGFKSSVATLSGVARTGVAPCPPAIASVVLQGCWVVVRATGRADDVTGIGPVVGSFEVVVQDKNLVDAPEIVVLRGHVGGELDLSPSFQHSRPLGTITGTFFLKGVGGTLMDRQSVKGTFTGVFRLPFSSPVDGKPSYMTDDGGIVPVQTAEFVLGYPAVKLEVTLR
jgi:hypothetical protein